jgi:hypothetical protein
MMMVGLWGSPRGRTHRPTELAVLSPKLAYLAAPLVVATACGSAPDRACPGASSLSIIGGSPDGSPEGQLNAAQIAAIGSLQSSPEAAASPESIFCTGTLVASRWVLSAAHCLFLDPQWFGFGANGQPSAVRIVRTFRHSQRDVALFELARALDVATPPLRPIPLRQAAIDDDWVGREVTLAGLGLTATGQLGQRHFIVEDIVAISSDRIVVDGEAVTGACQADSGGPLIANVPGEIIGVLSSGSTSCVGLDRYERVDQVLEWIDATMQTAAGDPCGGLDWEGMCAPGGGGPMWCDAGEIVTEECEKERTVCGYSTSTGGYRCVPPERDSCSGIGREAECLDELTLARCEQGKLVRSPCECGQQCVIEETAACR